MTTVDRLYNEALALSEEERWELVARLTGDDQPPMGPTMAEIMRRVEEARSGRARVITVDEAMKHLDELRERYRARQRS